MDSLHFADAGDIGHVRSVEHEGDVADCGDVGTVRSLCNIKETGTGAAAAGRRARPASLCALRGSVGPESSRGDPASLGKGCGVVDLVPEGADSVHCQTHSFASSQLYALPLALC